MYYKTRRTLKILSGYHYTTIFITVLLPSLVSLLLSYFELGIRLHVILTAAFFPVWAMAAVMAVA